jgi:hypothetical protein
MDISELNSQKTYETLPEQLAQLKQSMILANSGEQSYFSKIISDEDSCLFSMNSQIMDLISKEIEDDSEFNSDSFEEMHANQPASVLN